MKYGQCLKPKEYEKVVCQVKENSLHKLWIAVKDFKVENAVLERGVALTERLIERKARARLDDAETGELQKYRNRREDEIRFHSHLLNHYLQQIHTNPTNRRAKEEVQNFIAYRADDSKCIVL